MDSTYGLARPQNPKDNANIFSRLSFLYTCELFKRGYKKELDQYDLCQVSKDCRSVDMGEQMEEQWTIECKQYKEPSLYRLLWKCYGKKYLGLGILQLVVKTIAMLLTVISIERIVKHFKLDEKNKSNDKVVVFACLLVVVNLLEGFYTNNYKIALIELGMKIRTGLCSLVYRKCLKMSSSALSEFNTGQVVTLLTKDVYYIDMAIVFLNEIWISFFYLCFMTYLIYSKIGVYTFTGIGFILFTIIIEVIIGKLTGSLRIKTSKETDLRLHMTHELLSAIKMIKMYTWGNYFCEKISAVRKREVKTLRKVFYLNAITACLGTMCTKVAFYFLFLFYINGRTYVPAEIIYFTKSCFKNLTMMIMAIPFGIVQSANLYSAMRRLSSFLEVQDFKNYPIKSNLIDQPKVSLRDVSVVMNNNLVLKNVNLTFNKGLNIISGPNGAGKSTLLKTILHENKCMKGIVEAKGRISYAPEDPWLFPGTIKENIVFGEPFEEKRYQKVVDICCLAFDLNRMLDRDYTVVGDHGINLSKGQQARIGLARAIYRDSHIYLLDDSLSSLDINVQEIIFQKCIQEFLAEKICILVTNNTKLFKFVDKLVLVEDGIAAVVKPSKSLEYRVSRFIDDFDNVENKIPVITELKTIEDINDSTEKTKLLIDHYNTQLHSNVYYEVNKQGKVKTDVYKKYFLFGGSVLFRIVVVLLFFVDQGTISLSDMLVSKWVNNEQILIGFKIKNDTNSTDYNATRGRNEGVFTLYSVLMVVSIVLVLMRSFSHFFLSTKVSHNLHKSMIKRIVDATMEFFDNNFMGNILNRFSKDLATVDERVPLVLYECIRMTAITLCTSVLIACVKVILLVPILALFFFMFILRKYYLPTGRSLKRLECATRSPIVGHLNASLEGLVMIRAHDKTEIMIEEFDRHQDLYTSAYHLTQLTSRAFGLAVDIISSFFIATILLQSLLRESDTMAGDIGLVILQAITLTKFLEMIIQHWADLEYQMTSAERAIEYTEIKTENRQGKVLEDWPSQGTIEYKAVSLSYGKYDLPALKDIHVKIDAREKIGIVGRTGAGKSSFVSLLFRLYDARGKILIDGVDVRTVSVNILRSKIAIIPQNPLLFAGTVRSNLDPYHHHSDEAIWSAVEMVGLKRVVKSLTSVVSDGGSGFSSGQKQLLCLVRALIQKCKIIVLDEATGSVDPEASRSVNAIIQEKFSDCTILTIAHKLETVTNSDRILVVDQGTVLEFDTPGNLLGQANSRYRAMLENSF